MSIAKSDEIKNLLFSNNQLMATVTYPHTYCRAVPLQTACEIVDSILEKGDMQKTIAKEPVICTSSKNVYEWYCPTCGTRYESEAGACVHCPYCGQKIDWSNYDSE